MSESLRPEPLNSSESTSVANDAKTEDLLLTGLDRYFAGDYQQAINVWTRVLFLDRGHARARAYIERARSALAEQQRESEELLHSGMAAFNRGEIGLARSLLTSSVDRGGPPELALPILARLNRLETAASAVESAQGRPAPRASRGSADPPAPSRALSPVWFVVPLALGIAAVLAFARIAVDPFALAPGAASVTAPSPTNTETLPLVQPGEIAFGRAVRLHQTGHPRDALRTLERIRPGDPRRPDADRLRADIQRELLLPLATAAGTSSPAPEANAPARIPGAE
jgi:hypothetical protein